MKLFKRHFVDSATPPPVEHQGHYSVSEAADPDIVCDEEWIERARQASGLTA